MSLQLPATSAEFLHLSWSQIEPLYHDLSAQPLSDTTVETWLQHWSRLSALVNESLAHLYIATTCDTADKAAEERYMTFLDQIYTRVEAAEQELRHKLLASGLEPAGLAVPLRNMRAEAELFCAENLPLLNQERKLASEYNRIIGAQTVSWEGEERTIYQLEPVYQQPDRDARERAWRLAATRQLADRQTINALWIELLDLRCRMAANAGYPEYRAYRWKSLWRFDYTPTDCMRFHDAIEQVVVPAAARLYERKRQRLGLQTLRPWDLDVDMHERPPLRPFATVAELEQHSSTIFHQVDPQLGGYFEQMRTAHLLDLDNRKGKAPGGYCYPLEVERRPFIFMNAVGIHDDIRTMLHEAGHAFHVFETAHLPYIQQIQVGMEFAEVASMAMELLAAPFLPAARGGFYSDADAARARVEHLEGMIRFWPYMAFVDAFQHWAYTSADAARDPAACDATWATLWRRFMVGVEWSGLEQELMTGWHRKQHIYRNPFYYVEYGLAQLGAVQIWRNALHDQAGAVASYRRALALGGTETLPVLYAAAGARLAFDAPVLCEAVELLEEQIDALSR